MNIDGAIALVNNLFAYKEGAAFEAIPSSNLGEPGVQIYLYSAPVKDVNGKHGTSQITSGKFISESKLAPMSERDFAVFVLENLVMRQERHEALEWFRVDGQWVEDAHADDMFPPGQRPWLYGTPKPEPREIGGLQSFIDMVSAAPGLPHQSIEADLGRQP